MTKKRIAKKSFECENCGQCCRLLFKPNKSDIVKIEAAGHADFLMNHPFRKDQEGYMKLINGDCFFLVKNTDGTSSCRIYDARPKACRDYPFFSKKTAEDCKPMHHLEEVKVRYAKNLYIPKI
ncbi:YkgJ family cysteine cluster protein [Candidatus Woesearchaeota archaeon]|nr:YkgJ family cysteine cluster protein [Candidatus Woesearchaeota archaeon]